MGLLGYKVTSPVLALGPILASCVAIDALLTIAATEATVTVVLNASGTGTTGTSPDTLVRESASSSVAAGTIPGPVLAALVSWFSFEEAGVLVKVPGEGQEVIVALFALGAVSARGVSVNARLSIATRHVGVTVTTTEGTRSTNITVDTLLRPPAVGSITAGTTEVTILTGFGSRLGHDQLTISFNKIPVGLGSLCPILALGSVLTGSIIVDTVFAIAATEITTAIGLRQTTSARSSNAELGTLFSSLARGSITAGAVPGSVLAVFVGRLGIKEVGRAQIVSTDSGNRKCCKDGG